MGQQQVKGMICLKIKDKLSESFKVEKISVFITFKC